MAKTAQVKLYGYINEWGDNSAAAFKMRFDQAVKDADIIELHTHCYGGSVIDGNLIYNTIRNSKVPVHIYVDGVAASMGFVIMLAGAKIYMSENALAMVHAPSGYTAGNAKKHLESAKLLRTMEQNFIKVFTSKGISEKEANTWLEGDNWFSAEEMLQKGLIDGVVDKVASVEKEPTANLKSINAEAMYQRFAAAFDNKPKKNTGMTEIEEKALRDDLAKAKIELHAKEDEMKKLKDDAAAEKKKMVEAMVKGVKGLTVDQQASFIALGEIAGIESLKMALSAVGAPTSLAAQVKNSIADETVGSVKTFSELIEKGNDAIDAFKAAKPDEYRKLYKAEFGFYPA